MIDSGRLRHRVSIQERVNVLDSAGEAIQDPGTGEVAWVWSTLVDRWAAIEPLSGREFIQSQAVQSKVSGRVVIRWTPGINAGMRIRHQRFGIPDLYFNIEAILTDKDSGVDYMTLLVSEGVNEG